jgi:hypothetical protein
MREQRLIVVAEAAAIALGAAMLTSCSEDGGRQAKPASALMRDMDQDQPPNWRDEPEPPQFESPPPESYQ